MFDGGGSLADLAMLWSGQISKRMLQLRAMSDVIQGDATALRRFEPFDDNYFALSAVQDRHPLDVAKILATPQAGAWAAHCLRILTNNCAGSDTPREPSSLQLDLAHLGAIATVVAIKTKTDDELRATLPVRNGSLILPTLGRLTVSNSASRTLVDITVPSGRATVDVNGSRMRISDSWDEEAWGWEPIRQLHVRTTVGILAFHIDDMDPYLNRWHKGVTTTRLGSDALERWQDLLIGAAEILAERHADQLPAIISGLRCLIPLQGQSGIASVSSSSRHTPGAVVLTEPTSARQLAETLVHEVQHFKLNALHDLTPLCRTDGSRGPLYYSPWRTEPRSLLSLLHGLYAFLGVANFLRIERKYSGTDNTQLDFEFSRCLGQLHLAFRDVRSTQGLTQAGRQLTSAIGARIEELAGETVAPDVRRLADKVVSEHFFHTGPLS